jgi:Predicted membrane protein
MSTIEKIIISYVIVINVITLMIYGIDKWKAKHSKWRIPEATLLIMAAVGGSIGAWTGIKLFHHKTLHKKFKYGVPGIFLIQLGIVLFIYLKTNNLV